MNKKLLIILVLITSTLTFAQTVNNNLNLQLSELRKYLLEGDYVNHSKFTYPKVVKQLGGIPNVIKQSKEIVDKMKDNGYSFLDVSYKNTSKFLYKNGEMQCSLIQQLTLQTPNGKLETENSLIAISLNKGINWTFIDAANHSKEFVLKQFPNLHKDIVIQEMTYKNINE